MKFAEKIRYSLFGAILAGVTGFMVPAIADQVIQDNLLVRGTIRSSLPISINDGTAPVSGGDLKSALCATSTAGFCIYFGTGAPTITAAQGSLYLNLAGSSTSTRLFVNSTGSTTWVAITSAS